MRQYSVRLKRKRWETTNVMIEATSQKQAERKALAYAARDELGGWALQNHDILAEVESVVDFGPLTDDDE